LRLAGRFELLHLPLSSARRLVRVFRSVVQPLVLAMLNAGHNLSFGRAVAGKLVGNHDAWRSHLLLQELAQQPLGRVLVAASLDQNIEHDPGLVHGAPQPVLWVRVDPTAAPNPVTPESYVRLATIPHGDSLLALSTFAARLNTGPTISVDSTPFTGDIPDLNSSPASPVTSTDYLSPYRETPLPTECLPAGLDAVETIKNPTRVLLAAVANQTITETVVIQISTAPVRNGGIVNIPFVVAAGDAPDQCARLRRRHPRREQDCQPVRAVH
jgi:hypothetical protein